MDLLSVPQLSSVVCVCVHVCACVRACSGDRAAVTLGSPSSGVRAHTNGSVVLAARTTGTSPQVVRGSRLGVVWVFHNDGFLKVAPTLGWGWRSPGPGGKHRKRKALPVRKQRGLAGGAEGRHAPGP